MKSKELIEKYAQRYGHKMFLGFSGGKDSMTILDLSVQTSFNGLIIHNPKKDTHPETIKFIYEVSHIVPIISIPFEQMDDYIQAKDLKVQIDGSRISEFSRTDKADDFEKDGLQYSRTQLTEVVENGLFGITRIYPILNWQDADVFKYLLNNSILGDKTSKMSKEYIENFELINYMNQ